ncbi:MAG: hypothetical protein MJ092_07545, partial [Lachnospiraceae bacterium]|nr:hypothetical protein [Lachnospiraceae bacterium]
MKELFSIETDDFLFPLEDKGVFQVYNRATNTNTHLDANGNAVDVQFDEADNVPYESHWTNDPT